MISQANGKKDLILAAKTTTKKLGTQQVDLKSPA
jgi:hypothetical protein